MIQIRFSLFLAGFFLFLPLQASAGCNYIAEVNSKTLWMDISDGGCGDFLISFSTQIGEDFSPLPGTIKKFPFQEECVYDYKGPQRQSVTCHANGHTPLAGAVYQIRKTSNQVTLECDSGTYREDIYEYVCVQGCSNPGVPKILERNGHSCD